MGAQHRIRGCMQRPDTASAPPHQCTPANPAATITRSARFDRTFSRAPSKPNPHSARLHLSQLPAGSFPGGFPTTAPAQAAPSTAGRRPKPFTKAVFGLLEPIWLMLNLLPERNNFAKDDSDRLRKSRPDASIPRFYNRCRLHRTRNAQNAERSASNHRNSLRRSVEL